MLTALKTHLYPEGYRLWLHDRLPNQRVESLATCDACAMAPGRLPANTDVITRDPGPFDPSLKCCTYFPFIPNFGLGDLLQSPGRDAQLRLAQAAQTGLYLPLGLFAAPEREIEVKQAPFGTRRDLLCPFFDTSAQGCSIWKNRPGVCATYFCASTHGRAGLEYWANVESYLNHFEWSLANEVLWRLGFTQDDLRACEHATLTEEPGAERDHLVSRAWMEWSDRREDLLIACAKTAREITNTELDELLGDEALELEARLREG